MLSPSLPCLAGISLGSTDWILMGCIALATVLLVVLYFAGRKKTPREEEKKKPASAGVSRRGARSAPGPEADPQTQEPKEPQPRTDA